MATTYDNVTAITVNYKTISVTTQCITSIRAYYPNIRIIIIDNSNYDQNSEAIYNMAKYDGNIICVFNPYNAHHGPGMDTGINIIQTPFAFIVDSDTEIKKEGIIEAMLNKTYGIDEWLLVGDITRVDTNGFDVKNTNSILYGDPKCMLLNKSCYITLPPFIRHGAPCIETMTYLHTQHRSNLLIPFNWKEYASHARGFTQRKFGLDGMGRNKIPNIPPYTNPIKPAFPLHKKPPNK